KRYAALADIVKLSEDEAFLLSGTADPAAAAAALAGPAALVAVTRGERGSVAFYRGKAIAADTLKIEAIDTTGAGDAFYAAFLTEIARETAPTPETIRTALTLGNAAGALTATKKGAVAALPAHATLRAAAAALARTDKAD
ncbi:MAG: PfkB family carbohydrate kinase, partial [Clostridiales bacterium]|nr:PfkB family carbohydrate kinase [Clostridiales bacterium]